MKVNSLEVVNQSQLTRGHKSMPKYSNLKLKPQVQADVVLFKAKENTLTQEQKALNNLNAMLKQNFITPELNEVITKEVNSKNKNVVKYLSNINLEKDENKKDTKPLPKGLLTTTLKFQARLHH